MVDQQVEQKAEDWIDTLAKRWKILTVVGLIVAAFAILAIAKWTDWFPIEEEEEVETVIEDVIKAETGIDLNLFPIPNSTATTSTTTN